MTSEIRADRALLGGFGPEAGKVGDSLETRIRVLYDVLVGDAFVNAVDKKQEQTD